MRQRHHRAPPDPDRQRTRMIKRCAKKVVVPGAHIGAVIGHLDAADRCAVLALATELLLKDAASR
jgi:hypothetical protein